MLRHLAISAALCLAASVGVAQTDPSGISFVTIGSPGNAPWPGDGTADDMAIGRGSVDYSYQIGKFEITTAQWVDFFNAAFDRPVSDRLPNLVPPTYWGAVPTTPNTPGGLRWTVPAGHGMYPVGNISWRMAAMYCNWLCNDKSTDRSAFMNGAYDATTFGYHGDIATDQAAHNPGARYWIPTWDEWLKAAHFDPNKNGPGQGGWWTFSNGTDQLLRSGAPPSLGGTGQANWGFDTDHGISWNTVPLGSYTGVTSPWGLFDVAGGTSEWTESEFIDPFGTRYRFDDGSSWGSFGDGLVDRITYPGADFPSISTYNYGFRIASAVPAPGVLTAGCLLAPLLMRRRRKNYGRSAARRYDLVRGF